MKWVTIQQYVDLETGEMLKKEEADKYYRIIKTIKKTIVKEFTHENKRHRIGQITRINQCRRNEFKQNTLW